MGLRSSQPRNPWVHPCSIIALCALTASATVVATAGDLSALAGPLRQAALDRDAGSARYEVVLDFSSAAAAARCSLAGTGAVLHHQHGAQIQASVPAASLAAVAAIPGVVRVSEPATVYPCQGFGAVRSEAVQLVGAQAMHTAGYTGQGAKIAIIDLGFADLDETEVPVDPEDTSSVFSYRADGSTTASSHGTAVAEQVADMAPGADLTLIAVDTALSIQSAISYVSRNGFDVAVMALVLVDGPFDGTHAVSRAVNSAYNAGVFWVQPMGNLARRHWSGLFNDTDSDGSLDFSKSQKYISVALTAGTFDAYLSWYATAGSTTNRDYDLALYDSLGALVAQSGYTQNGDDAPAERLSATIPADGTYRLHIVKVSGPTFADKFELFTPAVDIAPATLQVADGSLGIPAEASGAFSVGATRGTTIDTAPYGLTAVARDVIEPFSGRGLSTASAIKPNLVAPDGCRTSLAAVTDTPIMAADDYVAPYAFGTSFAAAHVAGAAALLWSEDNTRTNKDLAEALVLQAKKTDIPPAVVGGTTPPALPNTTYGYGRLQLRVGMDLAKPVVSITYPANGDTITSTFPTITGSLSDTGGSGIDPATIVLRIDGVAVDSDDLVFDEATGKLTYTVTAGTGLVRGSHQITLDASDYAGNAATQASSSFRISLLTISAGLHMVSIPYDFTTLTEQQMRPSTVYGLPIEQIMVARWLPTDSTPLNKYHVFGGAEGIEDQYASFVPLDTEEPPYVVSNPPAGLGYFINADADGTINVGSASALTGITEYTIQLSYGTSQPRGWNMIGCPFQDAVSWSTAEFVTNGVRQDLTAAIDSGITEGILFELKTTGGVAYYDFPANPLSATIKPWQGYWVHVLKDTELVLYNATSSAAAPAATPAKQTVTTDNWSLRFGATMAGGADPANYIGVAPTASSAADSLDVPEPPALNGAVSVTMQRSGWGSRSGAYARDLRAPLTGPEQYDVEVTCQSAAADVTISWPEINATVPAGVSLVLKDLDAGREVYMRTASAYTYRSTTPGEVRHLAIVASPASDAQLLVSGITTTQVGSRQVAITYSVNQDAQVDVEIVNMAGRAIRRLGAATVAAGQTQTAAWDCRSGSGSLVPVGRYMLRLTARTQSGQVAHSVRTFALAR